MLKENEIQRSDGSYMYRWRTADHKRHTIYASTLDELREKKQKVIRYKSDGIKTGSKFTLNDVYDLWVQLKKGLKG